MLRVCGEKLSPVILNLLPRQPLTSTTDYQFVCPSEHWREKNLVLAHCADKAERVQFPIPVSGSSAAMYPL